MAVPASKAEAVNRAKVIRFRGAALPLLICTALVMGGVLHGPLAGALLVYLMVALALQTGLVRKTERLPDWPVPVKHPHAISLEQVRLAELGIWDQPFHCAAPVHWADAQQGRLQLLDIDGECPVCGPESDSPALGVQDQASGTPRAGSALTRRAGGDTVVPLAPKTPTWERRARLVLTSTYVADPAKVMAAIRDLLEQSEWHWRSMGEVRLVDELIDRYEACERITRFRRPELYGDYECE